MKTGPIVHECSQVELGQIGGGQSSAGRFDCMEDSRRCRQLDDAWFGDLT